MMGKLLPSPPGRGAGGEGFAAWWSALNLAALTLALSRRERGLSWSALTLALSRRERGPGGLPTTRCRLGKSCRSPIGGIALLAWLSSTWIAHAEDGAPSLRQLRGEAVQAAAEQAAPSVVRVETVGGLERVGKVLYGSGATSGLIVDSGGYILSSAFAFRRRPASVLVQLPGGARRPAKLVATDRSRMLVLLKIDAGEPLPVPAFAPPDSRAVGQTTVTLGRTFADERVNVAVGILSATSRIWGKAVQTDAAVSPANYGGPLIDLHGRVLGLLVPLSPGGGNDEMAGYRWYDSGIGFAVPAEQAMRSFRRMREEGDLLPGYLGAHLEGGNVILAEPVVAGVQPESPAAGAGLAEGDRIVEIDGEPISRGAHLKRALARRYAGDEIRLTFMRGDERIERTVTLAERPGRPGPTASDPNDSSADR
ncbi:MAG: S1C family serine protease [Pirellulales bacterium]